MFYTHDDELGARRVDARLGAGAGLVLLQAALALRCPGGIGRGAARILREGDVGLGRVHRVRVVKQRRQVGPVNVGREREPSERGDRRVCVTTCGVSESGGRMRPLHSQRSNDSTRRWETRPPARDGSRMMIGTLVPSWCPAKHFQYKNISTKSGEAHLEVRMLAPDVVSVRQLL